MSAATLCHVLPRGSGGHHLTRPLTGGQPPLTGGPAVVDRWYEVREYEVRVSRVLECLTGAAVGGNPLNKNSLAY
ncbi:hypothetical protein Tco_0741760 [Tanacetum coccineum]